MDSLDEFFKAQRTRIIFDTNRAFWRVEFARRRARRRAAKAASVAEITIVGHAPSTCGAPTPSDE